jgi:hypothetical protein
MIRAQRGSLWGAYLFASLVSDRLLECATALLAKPHGLEELRAALNAVMVSNVVACVRRRPGLGQRKGRQTFAFTLASRT